MPELDDVSQEFSATNDPWLAAVDEMIAKAAQFVATVSAMQDAMAKAGLTADDAAVMFDAAAGRASDLADAMAKVTVPAEAAALSLRDVAGNSALSAAAETNLADASADLMMQTALLASMDARLAVIQRDTADSSADLMMQTQLLRESLDALSGQAAGTSASLIVLSGAQDAAAGSARSSYYWWGLTGNALHWIIAGSAELAAVLIPATVAAGAWAFAWVQGATNVYQHLDALFTATEALGQQAGETYGDLLGLHGVWQQIQNEANPDVYQALGAAVNIVRESFGNLAQTGLQVGQVFDTFAAKVVYDFSSAGSAGQTMSALLARMVPDLTEIGQVLGNIGAAIASFASQMPGLAEVLLRVLDSVTDIVKVGAEFFSQFTVGGWSILTAAMAFEEFNRWGTLVVTLMGRLRLETTAVSGGFLSFTRFGSVFTALFTGIALIIPRIVGALGNMVIAVSGIDGPLVGAGLAMQQFGIDARSAIAGLSGWQMALIAAAAVGLGIFIDKLVTARSAAQQMTAAMQQQVTSAKNNYDVYTDVASNLNILQADMESASGAIDKTSQSLTNQAAAGDGAARSIAGQQAAYETAVSAIGTYSAAQVQQMDDDTQAVQGAHQIAQAFGITVPEAIQLANEANVNLSKSVQTSTGAWTALGEKVNDAYRGFTDMGVPAGAVGQDMLALAIDSGEAGTKMSQLNSAWDQFMGEITGGTSSLASFTTAMSQMGQIAGTTALDTGTATDGVTLSVTQFAQALTSMSGNGAQAWTNFDQAVGSTAPQLIDWLRTAGTMGAVSGSQIQQAGLDMLSALIPLASQSKVAQSELLGLAKDAGLNVTTFPQLEKAVQAANGNLGSLETITGQATINMGNMAVDAETLGNVMDTDLTSAISNAALKASGFYTAQTKLTEAVHNYGANSPQAENAAQQLAQDYDKAQQMAGELASQTDQAVTAMGKLTSKNITITASLTGSAAYLLETTSGAQAYTTATAAGQQIHAAAGGLVAASGGLVHGPGTGTSDSIHARLSAGEFVFRQAAVDYWGPDLMHAMNAKGHAPGGMAGSPGLIPQLIQAEHGGGGDIHVHHASTNNFNVNGQTMLSEVRTEQLRYERRNPSGGWSLRSRIGTPR